MLSENQDSYPRGINKVIGKILSVQVTSHMTQGWYESKQNFYRHSE